METLSHCVISCLLKASSMEAGQVIIADSLLHQKIQQFYQKSSSFSKQPNIEEYFRNDCTYNWEKIDELFTSLQSPGHELPESYEEYFRYYQHLHEIYAYSSEKAKILFCTDNAKCGFQMLKWLGCHDKINLCFENDDLIPLAIEKVLLLTASMENALGNVFFSVASRFPPHLLRDLLATSELNDVFGRSPMLFLKILMGSPNAINLRNIVWHGFPQPTEIPTFYVGVLLITACSLAAILDDKQIQIINRPQVEDISRLLIKFSGRFSTENLQLELQNQIIIKSSKLMPSGYTKYWLQLYQYFKTANWWRFILLILPQIELLLRLIYSKANDFDVRAKLNEYYITMDTIFENTVPDEINLRPNRLLFGYTSVSEGSLKLMYDLFISPNGLRIRDKVSHGEIAFSCIANQELCEILLYLSLNLLSGNETTFPLHSYESQFHINSITLTSICNAKCCLRQLSEIKIPFGSATFEYEWNFVKTCKSSLRIFDRHKTEAEVVCILMKISQLVTLTTTNYQTSFTDRFDQLAQRKLGSKRRKTLEKMSASLPKIWQTLCDIVQCTEGLFWKFQNDVDSKLFSDERFQRILRFCKHTLMITENFVKYSDKDSNEWIKAIDLCSKFSESRCRFVNDLL